MADSKFWLFQRAKFHALEGQLGHLLDRPDRDRWLVKGHCAYPDEPDSGFAQFAISGGLGASYRQDYTDIAAAAGKELECPAGMDPSKYWQHRLCQDLLNAREPEVRKEVQRRGRLGGIILDLVGSSASYCQRLATQIDGKSKSKIQKVVQHTTKRSDARNAQRNPRKPRHVKKRTHKHKDLLDRLAANPRYRFVRRSLLKAWSDSHFLVAEALAGRGSLPAIVEACVRTYVQGTKMQVLLKEGTLSARSKELDTMETQFLRQFDEALRPLSRYFRKVTIAAAKIQLSRKVKETTARAKRKMFQEELANDWTAKKRPMSHKTGPPEAKSSAKPERGIGRKHSSSIPKSERKNLRPGLSETPSERALRAKRARAKTVARLITELDVLAPQMIEDESEYSRLRQAYPGYLVFEIAERRRDLKVKVLSIAGSARHIRLAQELAGAYYGRKLSTIKDDWKDHKPAKFRLRR